MVARLGTRPTPLPGRRAETVRAATTFGSATERAAPRLAILDAVATACRDQVRLSFDYVAADAAATSRYVEPCQLVALDTRCNTFVPRPAPASDLYEYVRFNMSELSRPHRVVVDVEVRGAVVRDAYGAPFSVVGPPEFRTHLRSIATRFRQVD